MHSPSPAAVSILEETNEIFAANLALISRCLPSLYAKLVKVTNVQTTLVRVGDDDWDVEFRGARFFEKGSRAVAREQVETYIKAPTRFSLAPVDSSSVDRFTNSMMVPVVKRGTEKGVAFNFKPQVPNGWHLVLFGWGLGDHVFDLLEHTGAHNLIIIEANLEIILHSLRTFDWQRLLENPPHKPLVITWMMDELPPELLAVNVRANFRNTNLARVDGSYYFQHYANNFLQRTKDALVSELAQTFKGLGYVDDDLKMVRNAYQNLSSETAIMLRRSESSRRWPIFVIGSGPSLDASLDVIRANAGRAMIIACGTALPPLLKAGIQPDFFAELENGEPIYDWVSRVQKDMDFGDVICLASDTVDRRLKTLFERTVFFIRPGLASTPIFGDEGDKGPHALSLMHPTVGNLGLSFALNCGFREVYFFGLDLGSKQPDRHHANFSPYETGDDVAYTFEMNIARPGNFGGTVMTDNVMDWGRDIVEMCIIQQARGRMVYNCSDGVYIKGAIPKLPGTVSLPVPPTTREAELKALMGTWEPYGTDRFNAAWAKADLENQVQQFADKLKALCVMDHPTDPLFFLHTLNDLLAPEKKTSYHNMYRGTVQLALISGAYFVTHAPTDHQEEVAEIFIEEFKELIDRMTGYILEVLRGIRETGHYDLPIS